jgi:hypothetical protein
VKHIYQTIIVGVIILCVPKDLRALIPQELQMKACICQSCILAFKEDKEKFIKEMSI